MNEIENFVLESVGIVDANSAPDATMITERCVYIEDIPFVTDEKEQLEEAMKTHVESKIGTGVERVICRVKGSMEIALVVFKSVEDRKKFQLHGDEKFMKGVLKVEKILPVFETAEASVDDMYIRGIPGNKKKELASKLQAKFGTTFTSDFKKFTGTVKQIQEAVLLVPAALGLPEKGAKEAADVDQQSRDMLEKQSNERKNTKTKFTTKSTFPTSSRGTYPNTLNPPYSSTNTNENPNMTGKNAASTHPDDLQDPQTNEPMDTTEYDFLDTARDNSTSGKMYNPDKYTDVQGQQSMHTVDDHFSYPQGASNYPSNSQSARITSSTSTGYPSNTNDSANFSSSESRSTKILSSHIPVDKMMYQYMKLNLKEKLENIEKDHSVKIKFDSHELQKQDKVVVELKSKKVSADITRAKEEFLALQNEAQKDTKTLNVSCKGVEVSKHETMQENLKKKFPNVVVAWTDDTECVLLGKTTMVEMAAQQLHDTISCYESMAVDEITFEFLSTARREQVETIKKKFNIDIELTDEVSSDTYPKMAYIKPIKKAWKKKCKLEDLREAKEAFIDLYQQTFFSLKRVQVKCQGLSKVAFEGAVNKTKQKYPNVIITKPSVTEEIIICAEEKNIDDVVREFRSLAGLVSKRKLKKSSDATEQLTQRSRQTTSTYSITDDDFESASWSRGRVNATQSSFVTAEGLEIHIVTGDITTQKVDIIVNSANAYLNHNGGVSKAISAAAGPGLQRECNDILKGTYIHTGDCLDTDSFNLHCRRIVHAVGPVYDKWHTGKFSSLLERTYLNALLRSDHQLIAQSIAIPLMGSGGLGAPKGVCAEALTSVLTRFSETKKKYLKQVFLVNKDEEVTDVLRQNCLRKFRPVSELKQPSVSITTRLSYKTKKGLDIKIQSGDITKCQVEAIVNAANKDLRHGGGVAGAISKAAGREMQEECRRIMKDRAPLGIGECVVTSGYKLPCRIVHIAGPIYGRRTNDFTFYKELKETFLSAIRYTNIPVEAKTLAVPLISSGIYGGPKEVCAKALIDAIEEFDNDSHHIIKTIHLINLDEPSTQALIDGINKRNVGSLQAGNISSPPEMDSKNKTKRGIHLIVEKGDITTQDVDAILNPTDMELRNCHGVACSINKAAGPKLQKKCASVMKTRSDMLKIGEVILTDGFDLKCKYIFHTPSPYYGGTHDTTRYSETLTEVYQKCLWFANSKVGVNAIAVPIIGSGLGGCPSKVCAGALVAAIKLFDERENHIRLKTIVIVSINQDAINSIESVLSDINGQTPSTEVSLLDGSRLQSAAAASSRGRTHREQGGQDLDKTSNENMKGGYQNLPPYQGDIHMNDSQSSSPNQAMAHGQEVEGNQQSGIYNTYFTPVINKISSTVSFVLSSPEAHPTPPFTTTTKTYASMVKDSVENNSSHVDQSWSLDQTIKEFSPPPTQEYASTITGSDGNPTTLTVSTGELTTYQNRSQHHTKQIVCGKCFIDNGLKDLEGCSHVFCTKCIIQYVSPKSQCLNCGALYCVVSGPLKSTMTYYTRTNLTVPKEESNGVIIISYNFPDGIVQAKNYNGRHYKGNIFTAYLPNSAEGNEVLWLLRTAFIAGMIFKLELSTSSQLEVMWSGQISHKSKLSGGLGAHGYPDPDYLKRVKKELGKCGIVSRLSSSR